MHLVSISEPIDMGGFGTFPKGQFIMEDKNAAEMILQWPDARLAMTSIQSIPGFIGTRSTAKKILVAGGIGMGDAIMLTPVLRDLKKRFPVAELHIACFAKYRDALFNLPYIDGFMPWPLPNEEADQYDGIVFLEGFGQHPMARTHHQSEVFAEICGVKLTDKRCDYLPTPAERDAAIETFPRIAGRKRMGLQVQASHRCRTYPADQMRDLMQISIKDGWEVYLMGAPNEFACKPMGHMHDLREKAPAFRDSAAFLLTCDIFVGPDSGFLHVAGAMDVPAIGLFGAFPWKLRTANYKSVFAIQGNGPCSPCFHSPTRLQSPFPMGQKCSETGKCEVLAEITAARIKAKVDQVAR